MKRDYTAPEFEVVKFEETVLMDQPFIESTGDTKEENDPFGNA